MNLEDASIEIKGKIRGEDVTITGDIEDVQFDVEYDGPLDHYRLLPRAQYVLNFKTQSDGTQVMFNRNRVPVTKTAVVEAYDRTTEAFETARLRAGAPKSAKMRLNQGYMGSSAELIVEDLGKPSPIQVEFRWVEE